MGPHVAAGLTQVATCNDVHRGAGTEAAVPFGVDGNGAPALRTLIDIAPEVDSDALARMFRDCLDRRPFTVAEARSRLSQPDMTDRSGAQRLRSVLAGMD